MSNLKKKAEDLGIEVDGRWSDERIQKEIDQVTAQKNAEAEKIKAAQAEETARLEAEEKERKQAEEAEKARLAEEKKAEEAAEAQHKLEAKAAEEAEAQRQALEAEQGAKAVTVVSLQANPMRALGLAGYGEATLTAAQMADPRMAKKVERARELGLIKVK